jgi:hypothetical protein
MKLLIMQFSPTCCYRSKFLCKYLWISHRRMNNIIILKTEVSNVLMIRNILRHYLTTTQLMFP